MQQIHFFTIARTENNILAIPNNTCKTVKTFREEQKGNYAINICQFFPGL